MTLQPSPRRHGVRRVCTICRATLFFVSLIVLSPGMAQTSASTGTITGKIYNPATQEYVRNAEIAVIGTSLVTYSVDDGAYLLTNVPAGILRVSVTYTGYELASAQISVSAGLTATHDFELKGAVFRAGLKSVGNEAALVLEKFVVSSEREGNAKAIMEQRAAINVKNVVASDNFGDITDGNIGEFIKYLPGVVMDYNNSDARAARIGGLDPKYVGVSVDGMRMASAAGATFNAGTRQFEFEQASITGAESVEISKTTTASMDADAPAGTINMRSRNAFDRKGREVTAQLTFNGNTYAPDLRKTAGPYNEYHYKIRPGFVFTYAEAFKERFGVQLSLSSNTIYTAPSGVTYGFDSTIPARGPILRTIEFRDAPKLGTRSAFNLATDFRITPELVFSLRTVGSHLTDRLHNRTLTLVANAAQIDPASTLTRIVAAPTANANTRLDAVTSRRNKLNDTITYTPKLEFKRGVFTATAGGGYSRSHTAYQDVRDGFLRAANNRLTRMSWSAERSSPSSMDWHVAQLSGLPWTDPQSFNRSDAYANNIEILPQAGQNQVFIGYLDLKRTFDLGLPVQLGAGLKTRLTTYDLVGTGASTWTYVGAAGSQLNPSTVIATDTRFPFNPKRGGNVAELGIPLVDVKVMYDRFVANPTHFQPNAVTNYLNTNFSSRSIKEQVDAGYAEGNTRWRALRLNLGLRNERTRTVGKAYDLVPNAELAAARLTPNTIPYLVAQYRNGARTAHYGNYDNWFLSGGAKYALSQNLQLQLSGSQSIGRPDYNNLAGVITIDEANRIIRVPNPSLKPETSDKYFASLQYYLEPAGTITVSAYRLYVKNMGLGTSTISAADSGYADDSEYANFTFLRPTTADGQRLVKGVDVEYSQQLVFLPGFWRGFSVFGSVSRTIADTRSSNLVPKSANGGLRFGNHKFNLQVRCTWTGARLNAVNTATGEEQWEYERIMFDVSGGYKISQRYELTLSGRNVLDSPIAIFSNQPGLMRSRTQFGPVWTVGVRGRF